jgi:ribosomal protein S18 acetylase RimI-like enzyme
VRQANNDDPEDLAFLRAMHYEAAGPEPGEPDPGPIAWVAEVVPARYLAGWGRIGDTAFIAESREGEPVGAAWFRLFPEDEPGWGFVDEATPELALAVAEEHRRRGAGRALLGALIVRAKQDGFRALSLSTFENTSGARLYASLGFHKVATFDDLAVMRLDLTPA